MSQVTQILSAIEQGDPRAAEQLLPLVYDELRKLAAQRLAQEKPGQTLQATALVHEAYLRLVDGERARRWNSRGHFFAAAAEAMRRILVENARRKRGLKHGGGRERVGPRRGRLADRRPRPTTCSPSTRPSTGSRPRTRGKAELVKLRYLRRPVGRGGRRGPRHLRRDRRPPLGLRPRLAARRAAGDEATAPATDPIEILAELRESSRARFRIACRGRSSS